MHSSCGCCDASTLGAAAWAAAPVPVPLVGQPLVMKEQLEHEIGAASAQQSKEGPSAAAAADANNGGRCCAQEIPHDSNQAPAVTRVPRLRLSSGARAACQQAANVGSGRFRSMSEPPMPFGPSATPSSPQLARDSSAEAKAQYEASGLQRPSVRAAMDAIVRFSALRDSAGPAFIEAHSLTTVGTLGCGAYSTVDHCKLAIQDHFQQADGGKRYSKHNLPIAGASAGCNQATAGRGVVRRSSRRHMGSVPASLGAAVRDVAVKRLRPTLFDSPTELNDFVREAVLLAGLQHRSIVRVLGVGFSAAAPGRDAVVRESMFMVTELCLGGTLRDRVLSQMAAGHRKVVYTYADGLQWCAQVADGLAFLHAQTPCIIHRDVKLENVLLTTGADGRLEAKLADFGLHATVEARDRDAASDRLAALRLAQQQHAKCTDSGMASSASSVPGSSRSISVHAETRRGFLSRVKELAVIRPAGGSAPGALHIERQRSRQGDLTGQVGSFLGMAPEVTMQKQYNEKADVFSLGCVIAEVLGKQLASCEVITTGTTAEYFRWAQRVAAGERRRLPRNWPPQLADVVTSCLEASPDCRPTASEVAEQLQGMAEAVAELDQPRSSQAALCCCSG